MEIIGFIFSLNEGDKCEKQTEGILDIFCSIDHHEVQNLFCM